MIIVIKNLVNYYEDLLVRPFINGRERCFVEIFNRKIGGIYVNLYTSSDEERNHHYFLKSLELLNEYQDEWLDMNGTCWFDNKMKIHRVRKGEVIEIKTFREDVNQLLVDELCSSFEKKLKITTLSINRESSLDYFKKKKKESRYK